MKKALVNTDGSKEDPASGVVFAFGKSWKLNMFNPKKNTMFSTEATDLTVNTGTLFSDPKMKLTDATGNKGFITGVLGYQNEVYVAGHMYYKLQSRELLTPVIGLLSEDLT